MLDDASPKYTAIAPRYVLSYCCEINQYLEKCEAHRPRLDVEFLVPVLCEFDRQYRSVVQLRLCILGVYAQELFFYEMNWQVNILVGFARIPHDILAVIGVICG